MYLFLSFYLFNSFARERSCVCWFTSQMPTASGATLTSQEPGILVMCLTQVAGTQLPESSPSDCQDVNQQEAVISSRAGPCAQHLKEDVGISSDTLNVKPDICYHLSFKVKILISEGEENPIYVKRFMFQRWRLIQSIKEINQQPLVKFGCVRQK